MTSIETIQALMDELVVYLKSKHIELPNLSYRFEDQEGKEPTNPYITINILSTESQRFPIFRLVNELGVDYKEWEKEEKVFITIGIVDKKFYKIAQELALESIDFIEIHSNELDIVTHLLNNVQILKEYREPIYEYKVVFDVQINMKRFLREVIQITDIDLTSQGTIGIVT